MVPDKPKPACMVWFPYDIKSTLISLRFKLSMWFKLKLSKKQEKKSYVYYHFQNVNSPTHLCSKLEVDCTCFVSSFCLFLIFSRSSSLSAFSWDKIDMSSSVIYAVDRIKNKLMWVYVCVCARVKGRRRNAFTGLAISS